MYLRSKNILKSLKLEWMIKNSQSKKSVINSFRFGKKLNHKNQEKYKRTAEKKEIDYDAYLDAKLRTDMRETNKYLGKKCWLFLVACVDIMYSEIDIFMFHDQTKNKSQKSESEREQDAKEQVKRWQQEGPTHGARRA